MAGARVEQVPSIYNPLVESSHMATYLCQDVWELQSLAGTTMRPTKTVSVWKKKRTYFKGQALLLAKNTRKVGKILVLSMLSKKKILPLILRFPLCLSPHSLLSRAAIILISHYFSLPFFVVLSQVCILNHIVFLVLNEVMLYVFFCILVILVSISEMNASCCVVL